MFLIIKPFNIGYWIRNFFLILKHTLQVKYRVDQKKVNLVLDQLERCGFLHGVQDVSNNTSIVILDIAKF